MDFYVINGIKLNQTWYTLRLQIFIYEKNSIIILTYINTHFITHIQHYNVLQMKGERHISVKIGAFLTLYILVIDDI